MNTCSKEILKGYKVDNPTAISTNVPLTTADAYKIITVFNETDKAVKVIYKNSGGDDANFYVPPARSFTRVINSGLLINSLYLQAVGGTATGSVYINLGN